MISIINNQEILNILLVILIIIIIIIVFRIFHIIEVKYKLKKLAKKYGEKIYKINTPHQNSWRKKGKLLYKTELIDIKYILPILCIIGFISFWIVSLFSIEIFAWIFVLCLFGIPIWYFIRISDRTKIYENGITYNGIFFIFFKNILAIYPYSVAPMGSGLSIETSHIYNYPSNGFFINFRDNSEEIIKPILKERIGDMWDVLYKKNEPITTQYDLFTSDLYLEREISKVDKDSVQDFEKKLFFQRYMKLKSSPSMYIIAIGLIIFIFSIGVTSKFIIDYDEKEKEAYNMVTSKINTLENGMYVKIYGIVKSDVKVVINVTNPENGSTYWEIKKFNLTDETGSIRIEVNKYDSIYMGHHNNRDYWVGDKMCVVGKVIKMNNSVYVDADIINRSPTDFPQKIYKYFIYGTIIGIFFIVIGLIGYKYEQNKREIEKYIYLEPKKTISKWISSKEIIIKKSLFFIFIIVTLTIFYLIPKIFPNYSYDFSDLSLLNNDSFSQLFIVLLPFIFIISIVGLIATILSFKIDAPYFGRWFATETTYSAEDLINSLINNLQKNGFIFDMKKDKNIKINKKLTFERENIELVIGKSIPKTQYFLTPIFIKKIKKSETKNLDEYLNFMKKLSDSINREISYSKKNISQKIIPYPGFGVFHTMSKMI